MPQRHATSHLHLPLLLCALALLALGLTNLYSAATATASAYFYSQLTWAAIGVVTAAVVYLIDYRVYERLAYPFFGLVLVLLVAVLIFSRAVSGSQRWLVLGPLRLQPSELMKVAIIFALAKYFNDHESPKGGYGFWDLRLVWLMLGAAVVLVVIEPDLGTGMLVAAIGGSLVLFSKLRARAFLVLVLIGALSAPIAWNFVLKDYQKHRVLTLLDPESDPRGKGYHRRQSVIAVGSGQLAGKGFLSGTQSQLRFLPEQHTDFIFSVYAEEHGFLGGILLLTVLRRAYFQRLAHRRQGAREIRRALCAGGHGRLFLAKLHQHRDGHRHLAGGGGDPADDELRRDQPLGVLRPDRAAAQTSIPGATFSSGCLFLRSFALVILALIKIAA